MTKSNLYWLEHLEPDGTWHQIKSDFLHADDLFEACRLLSIIQGPASAVYLKHWLDKLGVDQTKYRYARWRNPCWKEREIARLDTHVYTKLPEPWCDLSPIFNHYAHVSEDGQKIAFTENEAKGELDVQCTMKPGRYLTRYYSYLNPETIRDLAALIGTPPTLSIAISADDIERVYLGGPSSCMSKPVSNYESSVHPVRVYGDSDLQVAYLGDLGDASARALIRPSNKTYVRIYGDETRMEMALEAAGYTQDDAGFAGARVQCIEHGKDDNSFVMPYLDGDACHVNHVRGNIEGLRPSVLVRSLSGFFMVLTEHEEGAYCCTTVTGTVGSPGELCRRCDDVVNDDLTRVRVSVRCFEYWCEQCVNEYSFYCEGSNETYCTNNYAHIVATNGGTYEETWFYDNGGFRCEGSDEYFIGEKPILIFGDRIAFVCLSYAEENCYFNPEDNVWHPKPPESAGTADYILQLDVAL